MKTTRVALTFAMFCLALVPLEAQEKAKNQEKETDQLAVIEQRIQSFVAAYNKQDSQAVADHWTSGGVYMDRASGQRITGREAIKKALDADFKNRPKGTRITVDLESLDLVSPAVALEEGTSTTVSPDTEPIVSRYTAVHVKQGDKWLIDRVSEHQVSAPPSHYEQLKDLEWLIGNWTDQSGEGSISTECNWARNQNFIIRSLAMNLAGQVDMAGMQIIGWDPARKQIRSWTFDSDGGFNQGTWRKIGKRWSADVTATLPDGRLASATSIMTPVDENRFTWQQINRTADGELLPNLEEAVIVRTDSN